MNDSEKRATIQDVAKLAGVSITTVSRVINDNYPVKTATKTKVNQAIEELNFKPNLLARSLIQDKSRTIGILTPSIENLFFSQVIKGIDDYTKEQGYIAFLCHTEGKAENEQKMMDSLINRSVDGIISIDPQTENVRNGYYEGVSKRLPLVLVNGYSQGINCNYVMNDEEIGTVEALKHFVSQGHSKIGFLRGRKSHSYDSKEEVFRRFLGDHHLPMAEEQIVRIQDGNGLETVNQAKEMMQSALNKSTLPFTALLCCNDWMAVGALNGARSLGLNVPKDISIIGFDNTIISQISQPTLSTVDHNMTRLGITAAERIFQIIDAPYEDPRKVVMTTKLIVRES